jgi:hypothetical protein
MPSDIERRARISLRLDYADYLKHMTTAYAEPDRYGLTPHGYWHDEARKMRTSARLTVWILTGRQCHYAPVDRAAMRAGATMSDSTSTV